MREHSRQEIYLKLSRKEYVTDVDLDALLDELEENNYLSDERFAESFIRYRASRGQGSVKIINELRLRGVKQSIIISAMQEADIDWFALAIEQYEKKFGAKKIVEFTKREKIPWAKILDSGY
ncbi:Regulatory protein RecX [Nymphon striatum]|nr:Regulatory protein RecX [Nymphon striatum]